MHCRTFGFEGQPDSFHLIPLMMARIKSIRRYDIASTDANSPSNNKFGYNEIRLNGCCQLDVAIATLFATRPKRERESARALTKATAHEINQMACR